MSFARMGVFKTVGIASAIGIGVAFLAADDVCCRRFWCSPVRAAGSSRGANSLLGSGGVLASASCAARGVHLVASLLVLAALASCAVLVRYNCDDRKALPALRAELDRVRRAGTSLPGESVNSGGSSPSSRHATCATRRPARTWSRWRTESVSCRMRLPSAALPVPPERTGTIRPPISRVLSAASPAGGPP